MTVSTRAAAVLCLVFLAPGLAALAAPARIARPGAEIRERQGFAGDVLARPPAGSDVELVGSEREWRRVRAGAIEGWVHELFVEPVPGAPTPAASAAPTRPPAPPPAVVPAASTTASDDVVIGHLRAEVARLTTEAMADRFRAEGAESALAALQARAAQAEAARDDALARLAAATDERLRGGVPEELLQQVRDEATREADARCAQDIAVQVESAIQDTMATLTSSEAERQRVDREVESRVAILKAQHDVELAACRSRAAAQPAASSDSSAEIARLAKELDDEKAAHAADVERIEDEHQRLHDTYVEIVTQRHEEALAREREACTAACDHQLLEERRRHDREIRSARKETGWEVEFEEELRKRTRLAVQEAEARLEAKRRGEAYDEQRVRREEEERVRKLCESERLAAVQSALTEAAHQSESLRRREREEADLRCQVALEVVLEQASQGGDLTKVRDLARERTRPAEPAPHDVAPPAEGTP